MKSQIINLLRTNPDWKTEMENLKIKVKEDGELAIFNYDIDANFFNPVVQEARGIIINTVELNVVCWPFRKFANVQENYADTIDWNSCRVEDKIDGSIVKLFYHRDSWHWATNSCIDAHEASISDNNNSIYNNFYDLISHAINYDKIFLEKLDKNFTYIFELVSPYTQIVIPYPQIKLYHIGTRNNITGDEYRINIGIDQPQVYEIHTLDDCLIAAEHLNDGESQIKKEGFVVVDKDWHRVKIKNPWYLLLHHSWNNGNVNKERIIEFLRNKTDSIENTAAAFSRIKTPIKYYYYKMGEFEENVGMIVDYARALYDEYNKDRKAVAIKIKNSKYSSFGFAALGNDTTAQEIINKLSTKQYAKYILDYKREDLF